MNVEPYAATIEGRNLYQNQLIPQRNAWILDQVRLSFKRSGQFNVNQEIIDLVMKDLQAEIETSMAHYSMDEIENILLLGSKGEFCDNVAVSSRSVAIWIRTYKKDYRPKLGRFYKSRAINAPKLKITKSYLTEKEVKAYIEEMAEQYHERGTVYQSTFDLLVKYGVLTATKEEKDAFWDKATKNVKAGLDRTASAIPLGIDEILEAKKESFEDRVTAEAKRLVLKWYFKQQKLNDK